MTATTITAYRDRTHGWVYCFDAANPWGMPQGPLPGPFTYAAEFETVKADLAPRFEGSTVERG